ncbi:TonB-dependent receptor [Pedobacter cryophilus]|uniref:TonB-dependent receptor n=2 Tax=Pedobacter cryophilus TaxID=2571271 RepID=A0A4U1C2B3_9SPHI|nr:TonB-dependent receptor [Pedobacter cryophilus]
MKGLLLLSWLFLSFSFYAKAQNTAIKITGTVVDAKGEQLIGVSVKVKGGTAAATTDVNGKFSLTVPNARSIVVFSYLGFVTKEELVGAKKILNVTLLDDSKLLNEIVVIGYGEVNRRDLTGSVSSVAMTDLLKAPVTSFDDALAGRIAGVQVTSPDGMPGAAPTIIIRGGNSVTQDNSPLYVIDGFPLENFDNNSLNPSDIESIDVLKDASSTAIYGSRGANGVIMITTKKGSIGAPKVAYKNFFGIQSNTNKIELMDPYEFVRYQLDVDSIPSLGNSSYVIYDIFSPTLNPTGTKSLEDYKVAGIDWQDQIFRNAVMQNHDISVRGGNKDTKYSVTSSYTNQEGTLIASDFKRFQARATLDQVLNKKFKMGLNVNYSNIATTGSQISGQNTTSDAFLISAWRYRPVTGDLDALDDLLDEPQDPSLEEFSSINYQWNPVLTRNNETRDRKTSLITANAYVDYAITNNLKLKVTGGINSRLLKYEQFNNSLSRLGSAISTLGNGGPNGSISYTGSDNFLNENTLTYNKIFLKKHTLNVVLGNTVALNKVNVSGFGASLVPNENLGVAGLSQGVPFSIQTAQRQNTLASFLGRVNYNYKSKYLATASFRADGSSKFVGDNIWGYFPSGSVAWRLSQEEFLKNSKWISDAKIRTSYGVIGNNRVSDYASYALLGTGGRDSYSSDGNFATGSYPLTLANPSLKWETTKEIDLGVDLGFFNQRITFVADYYNKNTTDLLLSSQLPGSAGYISAFQNIGSVQNRGYEFSLTTVNVTGKKFNWSSNFNISFNRNKVLSLTSGQNSLTTIARWSSSNTIGSAPGFIAQIGQPIGMFYGLVSDGVYQYGDFDATTNPTTGGITYLLKPEIAASSINRSSIQPGFWKFKDLNGDLVVDANDLTTIGNPNPDFIGGFSNNFSYKGFDLNVFLQFSYGNEIMNVNRILMEGGGGTGATKAANMFASYADRWSPTNPSNEFSAAGAGGRAPSFYPSRIVEDGSFIRLKTVNMGYAFNPSLTKKLKLNGLRLFASAQNLYTLTKYQGLDPEVNAFATALTTGLDYSAYPRARTVTFGLDITL